jgi:hypothetical protein
MVGNPYLIALRQSRPSFGGNQRQTRASLPRVNVLRAIQYPHGSWLVTIPRPKSAAQLGAVGSKL